METKHVGYLDGWRGFAILGVLSAHFFPVAFMDSGRLGVDLFFALSGLLMSQILYERRVPLREFYSRRISRVIPAFVVYVIVVFFVGALAGVATDLHEFIATLTFLRTYLGDSIWSSPVPIGHLWSLNVEEHTYIALATLTLVPGALKREGYALALLAALTLAANLYWSTHPIVDAELRTECAATGILASAGYRTFARRFNPEPWMPVAALLAGAACYLSVAHWALRPLVAPFLIAFAVNHLGASQALQKILQAAWLRHLGIWSFSLYLWQQPFFSMRHSVPPAVGLAAAFVVGLASFYFLENPVRRWLNQRWSPKPVASPAAP